MPLLCGAPLLSHEPREGARDVSGECLQIKGGLLRRRLASDLNGYPWEKMYYHPCLPTDLSLLIVLVHIMMKIIRLLRLLILLIILSTFVNAQTGRPKSKKNEGDAEFQQRRAAAVSLLQSLAIEARSYNDEPLRARVQAQIADVLWSEDKEAARTLFRRAWDIAEVLDRAGATPTPVGQRPRNSRTQPRSNLLREILKLASRRDHALGEEFLAKLTPRDDTDPKSTARELSATESTERLRLASELLEANNVAIAAAEKADSRARDLVEKIEDAETRKGVNTFVDYMLIRAVITQKRPDEALLMIRKAELPRTLRAHFLTRVATLKLKNDPVRATELLDEALTETRRLDPGTPDRAYSFVAVLRQFSALDRTRTWELLSETVKTINGVPDFTGERGQTTLALEGKFSIRLSVELAAPTDLTEVLRQLAEQNFYQAMDVSKTLRADAPRALAVIAVARAAMVEQP